MSTAKEILAEVARKQWNDRVQKSLTADARMLMRAIGFIDGVLNSTERQLLIEYLVPPTLLGYCHGCARKLDDDVGTVCKKCFNDML